MSDVGIWDINIYKKHFVTFGRRGLESEFLENLCLFFSWYIFRNISITRLYLELNIIALAGDVDAVGHHGHLAEERQLVLR